MKNRIAKIIENENLTNSQFANLIGVQPSAITHILSGRNEPSLKLAQRILDQFRDINSDWLILGKGMMHRNASEIIENKEDNTQKRVMHPVQQSLFPEYPVSTPENRKENELNSDTKSNELVADQISSQDAPSVDQTPVGADAAPEQPKPQQAPQPTPQPAVADNQPIQQQINNIPNNAYNPYYNPYYPNMPYGNVPQMPMGQPMMEKREEKPAEQPIPPRKVKKIIVFYSDGSYEEYGAQLNIN